MVIILVVLLSAFGMYTSYSFNHSGINRALVGLVDEDGYPDWDRWNGSEKSSVLECDIISKKGLFLSKIYLLERAGHNQIRFRVSCKVPLMHKDLLNDTDWVLEDSEGNRFEEKMVVYAEQIVGLNCINVTLVFGEEFTGLSGKELNISAVCSEGGDGGTDVEKSYAHCRVKVFIP